MSATGLGPTTFAIIGGIGAMEVIILIGLLVSCSILFVAMQNELSTRRSLLVTAGLYVSMAVYSIVMLN
jgi:uncharacterized protein (DUF983 family)